LDVVGSVRIQGWDAVYKSFDTGGGVNKTFHLIGTYHGWDPSAIYIAGYNYYNPAGGNVNNSYAKKIHFGKPERMTVDLGTGNVGIGITGPHGKLDIKQGHGDWISLSRTAGSGYWHIHNPSSQERIEIGYTPDSGATKWGMFVIKNNGNVGIGTTNPATKLDIQGGWVRIGNITSNAIQFETQSGFHRIAFRNLRFWDWDTGGDMVVFNNGKVGIGTTNPGYKLDVSGTIRARDIFGAGGRNIIVGDDTYLTDIDQANMLGIYGMQNSDRAGIRLGSDGSYIFGDNGNIGIGTKNPSQKLDVNGNINYSGQLTKLDVANNFTATVRAADFKIGYSTRRGTPGRALVDLGGSLALNYAGDWGMTEIHGSKTYISGKVGIGTTNPTTKLDVAGYVKGRTGLCIGNDCRTSWPSGGGGGSGSLRCVTYYNTEDVEYGIWYSGSLNSPSCPAGYKATGCAGGLNGLDMDSLSWDIYDTYCRINFTVQGGGLANDVDSTVRCCKVQ